MKEACSISLVVASTDPVDFAKITALVGHAATRTEISRGRRDLWELTVEGPSPVSRGQVANDLAATLLARLGMTERTREGWPPSLAARCEMRFVFSFAHLLDFSFSLDAPVLRGLAAVGGKTSFHVHDAMYGRDAVEPFGCGTSPDEGCVASAVIRGAAPGPDLATTSGPSRTYEADAPIAAVLGRLPTASDAWKAACGDRQARIAVDFRVRQMTGFFDLEPATMTSLADAGCGLDVAVYDWGPRGADCLGQ